MFKSNKALLSIGILGGAAVLLALGGLIFATVSAFAQTPTPPGSGAPAVYGEYFFNQLAGRLGVTADKLEEAWQGAFNDTVDQLVKDGKLSADQAAKEKDNAAQRLKDGNYPGIPFGGRMGPWGDKGPQGGNNNNNKETPVPNCSTGQNCGPQFGMGRGMRGGPGGLSLTAFAKALNMPEADLVKELQSGKSIADVAKGKNVELSQLKTSVLAEAKTQLDQAVKDGKLTQARADEMYNQWEINFDKLVNAQGGWMRRPGGKPQTQNN